MILTGIVKFGHLDQDRTKKKGMHKANICVSVIYIH